jgi:hypothetical protein
MAAAIHMFGADMDRIEPSAERDELGHIRLQLRINKTCESASAVMSLEEARAVVDCLNAAMAEGGAV